MLASRFSSWELCKLKTTVSQTGVAKSQYVITSDVKSKLNFNDTHITNENGRLLISKAISTTCSSTIDISEGDLVRIFKLNSNNDKEYIQNLIVYSVDQILIKSQKRVRFRKIADNETIEVI